MIKTQQEIEPNVFTDRYILNQDEKKNKADIEFIDVRKQPKVKNKDIDIEEHFQIVLTHSNDEGTIKPDGKKYTNKKDAENGLKAYIQSLGLVVENE